MMVAKQKRNVPGAVSWLVTRLPGAMPQSITYDGTVLHIMGDIEEIEDEVKEINESNEDVSSKLSSNFNTSYDVELE